MSGSLDVVAIGHAIVDVLVSTPDDLPARQGMEKGTMTLIDEDRAVTIYSAMGAGTEVSGGSAANTAAGVAAFGGTAGFIGKVKADQLGDVFAHDIRAAGVEFATPAVPDGPATGRSLIMVTPDAERTMATHLGAGDDLYPEDVDEGQLARAGIVYVEGYLCGLPTTDPTIAKAARSTHESGGRFALSLSDPFWVELHGDALRALLDQVDILFANEAEAVGLCGVTDLETAVAQLNRSCPVVAVTRGPAGSVVATGGAPVAVPAYPPRSVVDTTGAGDLYAAGFLYGLSRGLEAEACARLGGLAAAEVISHLGARPQVSLAKLASEAGLLG
jgi:sugar/nucleoside kinase (ribokinase family)